MALTFSGSAGALFNRFGRWAGAIADVLALAGGTATARVLSGASMVTRGTNLEADAASTSGGPALSHVIGDHWGAVAAFQDFTAGGSQFRALAEAELIEQVHLDNPLLEKTRAAALAEVRRQMVVGSESLNGSTLTIGAQASLGSPTGNPVFVATCTRGDGLRYQTPRTEVVRFSVTDRKSVV